MPATTIKVPSELRDRLNAEARRDGTTVAGVIEKLVAERERSERFRAIKEAASARVDERAADERAADERAADERADDEREVRDWDAALTDGLDGDQPK